MSYQILVFDLENAKQIRNIRQWRQERPVGISCAATLTTNNTLRLWHGGEQPDGRLRSRMSPNECIELARYLLDMQASGYTVLTWNGLDFDLNILAEECQDSELQENLADLALNHIDVLFAVFSETGSFPSLDKAARGMGQQGKLERIRGEDVPKMWATSRALQDKVLQYVTQDVRATLKVYEAIVDQQLLLWETNTGQLKRWNPRNGYVPTVSKALEGPEPDISWMANPTSRVDFCDWIQEILPNRIAVSPRQRMARWNGRTEAVQDASEGTPKRWTIGEEERLLTAFDRGARVNDLAKEHGRTSSAIRIRLHKLGRVLPGEEILGT